MTTYELLKHKKDEKRMVLRTINLTVANVLAQPSSILFIVAFLVINSYDDIKKCNMSGIIFMNTC